MIGSQILPITSGLIWFDVLSLTALFTKVQPWPWCLSYGGKANQKREVLAQSLFYFSPPWLSLLISRFGEETQCAPRHCSMGCLYPHQLHCHPIALPATCIKLNFAVTMASETSVKAQTTHLICGQKMFFQFRDLGLGFQTTVLGLQVNGLLHLWFTFRIQF